MPAAYAAPRRPSALVQATGASRLTDLLGPRTHASSPAHPAPPPTPEIEDLDPFLVLPPRTRWSGPPRAGARVTAVGRRRVVYEELEVELEVVE